MLVSANRRRKKYTCLCVVICLGCLLLEALGCFWTAQWWITDHSFAYRITFVLPGGTSFFDRFNIRNSIGVLLKWLLNYPAHVATLEKISRWVMDWGCLIALAIRFFLTLCCWDRVTLTPFVLLLCFVLKLGRGRFQSDCVLFASISYTFELFASLASKFVCLSLSMHCVCIAATSR